MRSMSEWVAEISLLLKLLVIQASIFPPNFVNLTKSSSNSHSRAMSLCLSWAWAGRAGMSHHTGGSSQMCAGAQQIGLQVPAPLKSQKMELPTLYGVGINRWRGGAYMKQSPEGPGVRLWWDSCIFTLIVYLLYSLSPEAMGPPWEPPLS